MKMKHFDRSLLRIARFLLIALLYLLAGCTQPPYYSASWDATRGEMGTMGVVAAEFEPARSFEGYARGRLSGAGRGAALGTLSVMSASGGDNLFILLMMPPAAVVGAVVGMIVAEPKQIIKTSEAEAKKALADLLVQRSLQEMMVEHIRRNTPHAAVLIPAGGPGAPEESSSYTAFFAEQGVDTVLEVAVLKVGSRGPGVNAPVALFLTARARLLRTQDDLLLFEGNYVFISERRKFTEWCADHAVLLSDAYRRAVDELASQVVEDLFLSLFPNEVEPLHVIEPSGRFGRKKIASLQPTFEWEAFPRPEDQSWIKGREIDNVTYDLRIIQVDEPGFSERVIERRGLTSSVHALEAPLAPKKKYIWSVRSRFDLQGEVRVTEWGTPVSFKTPGK